MNKLVPLQTLVNALPLPDFSDTPCSNDVIIESLQEVKSLVEDGYSFICLSLREVHRGGLDYCDAGDMTYRDWFAEVGHIRVAIESAVTSVVKNEPGNYDAYRYIEGGQGIIGTAMFVYNTMVDTPVEFTMGGRNAFSVSIDVGNGQVAEHETVLYGLIRTMWIDRIIESLKGE